MAIFGVFKTISRRSENHKFSRDQSRPIVFCLVLEEHDESSRIPACTWVCALSFGRCRMSKFFLLVYLDFFEILRRSLRGNGNGR